MSAYAYDGHFPFKEIREEQRQAIEFALDAFFLKKKRVVILEMGTGCGKSATAVTIARYMQSLYLSRDPRVPFGSSYILTTQKVLQEQYMRDFGAPRGNLKLVKSAGSYTCQFFDETDPSASCAEIQRLLTSHAQCKFVYKACTNQCRFKEAREAFVTGDEGITNYSYFLTTSTYTREMQHRGLLVLDEAHNVENIVSSFVKIAFSNHFYKTVLGVKTPPVNAGQDRVYDWLVHVCKPRLREVIKKESKKVVKNLDSAEAIKVAQRLENLKRNFTRIEYFIQTYDPNTWVLDSSKTDVRGERVYEFKPVVVGSYCQNMLFAACDRVLILSGTILDRDVYCESVGIDPNDAEFLRIPSPFPVENRPILPVLVGHMSKDKIEKTLPVMATMVKELLNEHANEKGIIHCGTYRIANFINQALNDPRILTHTSENRDAVIQQHCESPEPTVLLSPSMMEGVDLADDKSRFQILCKIPFPYLGDVAVKKRMQKNKSWYGYQTVKQIVQAFGRSIRNENDYAVSYILDSDWERFYRDNAHMFPEEFRNAVKTPV